MGWCSATSIFDKILDQVLSKKKQSREKFIESLINTLEDNDWDCQQESEYWDHPIVRKVFEKLHPEWFEDDYPEIEDVVVVMTGFRDARLQVAIEDAGGRVTGSVSRNTTHLLVSGKSAMQGSSKYDKAEEYGAIIMTPEEFRNVYDL